MDLNILDQELSMQIMFPFYNNLCEVVKFHKT